MEGKPLEAWNQTELRDWLDRNGFGDLVQLFMSEGVTGVHLANIKLEYLKAMHIPYARGIELLTQLEHVQRHMAKDEHTGYPSSPAGLGAVVMGHSDGMYVKQEPPHIQGNMRYNTSLGAQRHHQGHIGPRATDPMFNSHGPLTPPTDEVWSDTEDSTMQSGVIKEFKLCGKSKPRVSYKVPHYSYVEIKVDTSLRNVGLKCIQDANIPQSKSANLDNFVKSSEPLVDGNIYVEFSISVGNTIVTKKQSEIFLCRSIDAPIRTAEHFIIKAKLQFKLRPSRFTSHFVSNSKTTLTVRLFKRGVNGPLLIGHEYLKFQFDSGNKRSNAAYSVRKRRRTDNGGVEQTYTTTNKQSVFLKIVPPSVEVSSPSDPPLSTACLLGENIPARSQLVHFGRCRCELLPSENPVYREVQIPPLVEALGSEWLMPNKTNIEVDVIIDGVDSGNPQKFVYSLNLWILQQMMQMSSVAYDPVHQPPEYFHQAGLQPGLYNSQTDNHPQVTEPQLLNYYKRFGGHIDFKAVRQEYSLLHWAAAFGFPEVCQFLISEKGVDVNVKNSFGVTPLHVAVAAGEAEVVDLLLGEKAAVDSYDADGNNSLDLARKFNDIAIIESLESENSNCLVGTLNRELRPRHAANRSDTVVTDETSSGRSNKSTKTKSKKSKKHHKKTSGDSVKHVRESSSSSEKIKRSLSALVLPKGQSKKKPEKASKRKKVEATKKGDVDKGRKQLSSPKRSRMKKKLSKSRFKDHSKNSPQYTGEAQEVDFAFKKLHNHERTKSFCATLFKKKKYPKKPLSVQNDSEAGSDYGDLPCKVLLLGDANVGKTTLILRHTEGAAVATTATVGLDYKEKVMEVDNATIAMRVWDTCGQERFDAITSPFYRNTNAVLVVFDVTAPQSFQNAEKWMTKVAENVELNAVKILVGNKIDLHHNRRVDYEEASALAQRHRWVYMETSATAGTGVERTFTDVAKKLKTRFEMERQEQYIY